MKFQVGDLVESPFLAADIGRVAIIIDTTSRRGYVKVKWVDGATEFMLTRNLRFFKS